MEQGGCGRSPFESRTPRGSQGQGLRGRDVLGVRQLYPGAQRHLHEVRYLRIDDGVFVNYAIVMAGRGLGYPSMKKGRPNGRPFFLHRPS